MSNDLDSGTEALDDDAMPLGQIRDQQAHEVLAVIGNALRLDSLELDDENQCSFTVDDKYVFLIYFDYGGTHDMSFSLPLGFLPQGTKREQLLADLMAANYAGSMTDGGVLGIDDESSCVVLTRIITLPMEDNTQITDILGRMISVGQYWMDQIAAAQDDGDQPETGSFSGPQIKA
jgi:hypothetical protein